MEHGSRTNLSDESRLKLVSHASLKDDRKHHEYFVLLPERAVRLNGSAFQVLSLCDGNLTFAELVETLQRQVSTMGIEQDVREFVGDFLERGWLEIAND